MVDFTFAGVLLSMLIGKLNDLICADRRLGPMAAVPASSMLDAKIGQILCPPPACILYQLSISSATCL